MSVKVDFYLLETARLTPESVSCRLAAKAYQQGASVDILATSEQHAHLIDEQLWSEPNGRFLPHQLADQTANQPAPIMIRLSDNECSGNICINLTVDPVAEIDTLQRILEIVPAEPGQRTASREKYKAYRARQWELSTHKLR